MLLLSLSVSAKNPTRFDFNRYIKSELSLFKKADKLAKINIIKIGNRIEIKPTKRLLNPHKFNPIHPAEWKSTPLLFIKFKF